MKPYIICHMLSSVDGKIDGAALGAVMDKAEYEATAAKLKSSLTEEREIRIGTFYSQKASAWCLRAI